MVSRPACGNGAYTKGVGITALLRVFHKSVCLKIIWNQQFIIFMLFKEEKGRLKPAVRLSDGLCKPHAAGRRQVMPL